MPYHRMTDEAVAAFLRSPVRPAILATTRADGRAHAAPIWYELDGPDIVFTTGAGTVKGRNLAARRSAALCVQDDRPPFSFVTIEGTVRLSDDLADVRQWATRIGGRYMGDDRAAEYGARNAVEGELLVRLTPTHVVSAQDVAD